MGVNALPSAQGSNYDTVFELDGISVELLENGNPVGEDGVLKDLKTINVKPGMTYQENISVRNNGNAPEFVRLVVRKYWTEGGKTVKDLELTPALIELGLSKGWTENGKERTDEMSVYYCKNQLAQNEQSQAIETVRVDGEVLTNPKNITVSEKKGTDKTVYIYTYKYDGYALNIEAEAQAVQTHNAKDAIKSIWGVDNVTASGDSLTVEE